MPEFRYRVTLDPGVFATLSVFAETRTEADKLALSKMNNLEYFRTGTTTYTNLDSSFHRRAFELLNALELGVIADDISAQSARGIYDNIGYDDNQFATLKENVAQQLGIASHPDRDKIIEKLVPNSRRTTSLITDISYAIKVIRMCGYLSKQSSDTNVVVDSQKRTRIQLDE